MQEGDTVKIYQKPITEEDYEGEATLLECINADAGHWNGRQATRWKVRFNAPAEPVVQRTILEPLS